MQWSGVLFDLFGTIVEPFPMDRHECALAAAAEAVELDPGWCSQAWAADYSNRVRGRSGAIAGQLRWLAAARGVALDPVRLERATERYVEFTATLMTPLPGAVTTLERLAEIGTPVGLVSNAAPDFVTAFERSPLGPLFRTCVFSCAVGMAKPEVAIYLRAASQIGVPPDRLLFVGDGSDDELVGAGEAGLTPILVEVDATNTYDPEREMVRCWSGPRLHALPELLELLR